MRVNMMAVATGAGNAWARARRATDDLSGEVALVTGASRGLGLLLARELARHSCRLIIMASDGTELDQAAGRLRSAGAEVVTAACDIRDEHASQLSLAAGMPGHGTADSLAAQADELLAGFDGASAKAPPAMLAWSKITRRRVAAQNDGWQRTIGRIRRDQSSALRHDP